MNPDTTYTRTLLRALKAIGSETKLAEMLRTSPEILCKWISGELQPPSKVYFTALDIATRSVQKPKPKSR
jgi:DNA-binding transcriptional regulator YdaS (Cro superfamily)